MIRINHDTIEIDGTIAADFRPNYPLHLRDHFSKFLELEFVSSRMIYDGDYIDKTEYDELETELKTVKQNSENAKYALQDLLNDLDRILESCGKTTAKKFDDFAANLTSAMEDIQS